MGCHIHKKDPNWNIDLIWKYFHEVESKAVPLKGWFRSMDPNGTLDDRHHVYELLVDSPSQSAPGDVSTRDVSMIPWNQNHKGMVSRFGHNLACGSVVKLAFMKYMGWGSQEPKTRATSARGFDAPQWVAASLWRGTPVRAYLKGKDHYVGIVGYRTRGYLNDRKRHEYDFLVMDPWAGGASTGGTEISYGGGKTTFLGIMKETGGKLMYDGYEVTEVGGHEPFPK